MCTGRVLETFPSDFNCRRYEVFWGWGTSDTQLARWKLDKKNTPQLWQLPSAYDRHGALPPAPPQTTISQHAARQVYVVKTREYNYCFYYLLVMLRHNALSMPLCLCVCGLHQQAALRVSYSQRAVLRVWCCQRALRVCYSQRRRVWCSQHALRAWEYDTLSAVWSCYYANSGTAGGYN